MKRKIASGFMAVVLLLCLCVPSALAYTSAQKKFTVKVPLATTWITCKKLAKDNTKRSSQVELTTVENEDWETKFIIDHWQGSKNNGKIGGQVNLKGTGYRNMYYYDFVKFNNGDIFELKAGALRFNLYGQSITGYFTP